jgi:uncharacterized HhH-GPD family protein
MKGTLAVTGDADADELLNTDPFALVIGMLLDQQVPMEWAFIAPYRLRERLGGELDPKVIAAMDPDDLIVHFKGPPALHRFPGSMAKRTHDLSNHIVDTYGGDAEQIWSGVGDPAELLARLRALPGYGNEKARIFLALLAKRIGNAPDGWEALAAPFGDGTPRSVADIDSPESLQRVREWKKAQKAKGKGKQD